MKNRVMNKKSIDIRKQNSGKLHHLRQTYLRKFFKSGKKSVAIHSLKAIEDLSLLRDIQKCVSVYSKSIVNEIEGNLFPKNFKEMCTRIPSFVRPVSLNSELVWFCSYFNKYCKEIKWFLIQKKEYEQSFLLGEWIKCDKLLESVRERLGVSLWYFEAKFLLFEYCDKKKDGIMMMSDCLKSIQDVDINHLPMIVNELHQRTTTNISPFKFDEDLEDLYKRNKTLFHEDCYRYYLFRLNFFNHINQEEISYNMMFESISSLVDRYLMAVNLLKAESMKGELNMELKNRVSYLYSRTEDAELTPLIVQISKNKRGDYYDKDSMALLDSYYNGQYENTLELCKAYVRNDASFFDIYVIYGRCLIYLGRGYEDIVPNNCQIPSNKLCRLVYNTLNIQGSNDALYSLFQMNKNLYGFHLAAAMHVFVKHEMNEDVDTRIRSLWNVNFDPEFGSSIYQDTEDAIAYLQTYPGYYDSVVCKVYKSRLLGEELSDSVACYNIRLPHNATITMQKGEYDDAFNMWERFYEESICWLPNRQKAVRNMVECLFKGGKVEGAISLYVDYLLKDQPSIQKVDTGGIIKYLQDNLYEDIRRDINLAIFMGLNCNNGVDKSFILLEFCEIKGVERPSDLIGRLDESKDRQEAFFAIMNDDETLRHYFNIPSLKDRLNERQKILNYLISLETDNLDMYKEMLKEIEDALLVYRVSSNLNEGKIYANDQAILKYKLNEIDGLYNRFVQLLGIILNDKKSFYVLDSLNSTVFCCEKEIEGEDLKSKININENGVYEVFYSLYDYILDKFLYSEFGLVAYLSTRVRHGELESKLRPELAQRNLILQIKDNCYQPTQYWALQYNLNSNENSIVNEALAKFSKSFDEEVVELIKERLQIFDNKKKPKGLFNFDTDTNELPYKAMEIGVLSNLKGKDEFCKLMIEWLWQKTEISLANIRQFIANEFTEHINTLFDTLKYDLRPDVLPVGHAQSFLQATIAEASTVIASRIKNIESWFNVSGLKLEDVDLKQLTHQVYNNIISAYPQYKVKGKPKIEGESFKLKSCFVLHYKDLLTNLITNMLKHGDVDDSGMKPVTLNFNINEDKLLLYFENKVKCGTEDSLNKTFVEKLSTNASFFNSEGGSGISKAKKILKSDLQEESNEISIEAKDGACVTKVSMCSNKLKANEQEVINN